MDSISGELVCGVCLEFFEDPLLLPCGHNFCKKCIYRVIENYAPFVGMISMGHSSSYKCPVCQKSFNSRSSSVDNLPKNKVLESIISLHMAAAPVDIFDTGWSSDLEVKILKCIKHELPLKSFCRSCNLSACEICEKEHHQSKDPKQRHKVLPIKEVAYKHQAEIAEALTEIKKKSINLNDRLTILKDMEEQIERNEKSILSELDHHVNTIMSSVRRQQEELKRSLKNDFEELKKPFVDELRRCNSMKTSMSELMKKVSDIKRTTDTGLRISLMSGTKKQLNSLLCFDIAWSVKDHSLPVLDLPTWRLDVQHVMDCIGSLKWIKEGAKLKTVASQTEVEATNKNDTTKKSSVVHQAHLVESTEYKNSHNETQTSKLTPSLTTTDKPAKTSHLAPRLAATDKPAKTKIETTFGVDNIVAFGDKSKTRPEVKIGMDNFFTLGEKAEVRPKVKSDFRSSLGFKLPQDVEIDGEASDENISNDGAAKLLTVENLEHTLITLDSSHLKKLNKNISPLSGDLRPTETIELIRSQTSVLPNFNQNNTKAGVDSTRSDEKGVAEAEEIAKVDVKPKVTVSHIESSSITTTFSMADSKLQNSSSARPKYTAEEETPKLENFPKKSENVNGKSPELMEISQSFDDDKTDEQFLSQSLNRISFQPKSEVKEDHRNSYPPDTLPSSNLMPRTQPFHKFEKPKEKQRSPHQHAVAKFVARRRTGSPHISRQSQLTVSNATEFPKTMSSPALSHLSAADQTKGVHGRKYSDDSSCKTDNVVLSQGLLYPEKSVHINVGLKDVDMELNVHKDDQAEELGKSHTEETWRLSPKPNRKIIKGKRFAEKT